MEGPLWEVTWEDPFAQYLRSFEGLIGDRRTGVTFRETVKGIIASGSTRCRRIAASSSTLSQAKDGAQRVLRMATGESTKRSTLDAASLTEKLRERGLDHLVETDEAEPIDGEGRREVWLIADGSELRKPCARSLPHLMKVRALDGTLVPGYRTLQVIGITPGRRGLLYHRLFSSEEPGFVSEPSEVQTLLQTVSQAVKPRFDARVWILDSGFDDVAVLRTIWEQGEAFVCRIKDGRRLVAYEDRQCELRRSERKQGSIAAALTELRPLAEAETRLDVRLKCELRRSETKVKRQSVKAVIAATPIWLTYDPEVRREPTPDPNVPPAKRSLKKKETRPLWLVEIRLPETEMDPIHLLCSEPVEDETSALRVLRMYRQRWSIEDAYGFTKECIAWEEVQLLDLKGIRTLVALAWVAAGFLYELGVTFEWEEVQLLAKLGGFVPHKGREPGRRILTWGLQRLLEMLTTHALFSHYQTQHGSLPPNIRGILGSLSLDPL